MVQNGAKSALFPQKERVSYGDFLKKNDQGRQLTEQLDTIAGKIASLESEAAALRTQADSLEPWLQLDVPLEQLAFTVLCGLFARYPAGNRSGRAQGPAGGAERLWPQ